MERHTDGYIDRHTNGSTHRRAYRWADIQMAVPIYRQTDIQTDIQMERHAGQQIYRQTDAQMCSKMDTLTEGYTDLHR